MTRIKIISNPYEELTTFEIYDGTSDVSQDIQLSGYNGDLINSKIKKEFFPFNAKKILDIIIEDFGIPNDTLFLEFEGTSDEFDELKQIITGNDLFSQFHLEKSENYLENARDILPKVIDVFNKVFPLIELSISDKNDINQELNKFTEASNADIPIYLLGNYSAGKSTFINSLVGYEVLPSSAKPTTAKIYKIKNSAFEDTSRIEFFLNQRKVSCILREHDYKIDTAFSEISLIEGIKQLIEKRGTHNHKQILGQILELINEEANKKNSSLEISDLISVELPFSTTGILKDISDKIVIFDTPGSDTANNKEHSRILSQALEGLSNGLPIILSEYESLDRLNADMLADEINSLKELDNRFTMIIVNKADSARLNDFSKEDIMEFAVPRKLYSSGIYFVSSLIGLGSKNNEVFIDEYNAEIFSDQKNKYINQDSHFYKQLYTYNVLPDQIKERYVVDSQNNNHLLYVNSGLEEVEHAISDFVKIYSPYNKCQQSKLFLNKIFGIISDEIRQKTEAKTQFRDSTYKNLKVEEQQLVNKLNSRSEELFEGYIKEYPENSDEKKANVFNIAEYDFTSLYNNLREKSKVAEQVDYFEESRKNLQANWINDLKTSIRRISTEPKKIREIGHELKDEFSTNFNNFASVKIALNEAKNNAEDYASDELIENIRNLYTSDVNNAKANLEKASIDFWEMKSREYKDNLANLISKSESLTFEERENLKEHVISYDEFAIRKKADTIFDKNKLSYKLFGNHRKINIGKVKNQYKKNVNETIDELYNEFKEDHRNGFKNWSDNLLSSINENIVNLNPELRHQSEIIDDFNSNIQELNERLEKIINYTEEIKEMMAWKQF